MNTGKTYFKKGNSAAKGKKGKQHKVTMIKILLQDKIGELDYQLYNITMELLNSRSIENRKFAWKELLKYRLTQMREVSKTYNASNIVEIYLNYMKNLPLNERCEIEERVYNNYLSSLTDEEIEKKITALKKVVGEEATDNTD